MTYLEEFLQRGLVDKNKQELFTENYKDPDEYCCLFVIDEDFHRFIYIPYPTD